MDFSSIPSKRWVALAGLGAATGLRSMTPPAALALRKGALPNPAKFALIAAAIGELAGDKHPAVPSRTSPSGLAGRVLAGAGVGYVAGGAEAAIVCGIVAAAAGAGAAKLRGKLGELTGQPDAVIAVGEDWIAIALTAATVDVAID
ncbi:MAG: hypothetical protein Q7T55_13880 [Solirubrobacteraceae bacterium]|nr:hypothetical protein [Solirubrobacteraceae bacterium]